MNSNKRIVVLDFVFRFSNQNSKACILNKALKLIVNGEFENVMLQLQFKPRQQK